MPRVSRRNPACDGSDEEPQKRKPKNSEAGGQSSTVESVTSLITTWLTVFRTLQIVNRVHWRRRLMSLVRTVRKARFERLLKVHRGALVSFMGSGFYGGDIFMVKYL